LGYDWLVTFTAYGPFWRTVRRGIQEWLNQQAARRFEPIEEFATRGMLNDLLHTPEEFMEHARQ